MPLPLRADSPQLDDTNVQGLELDEQSPDRKTYLTYNLSSAESLLWQEFSALAKANKFADEELILGG